MANPTQSDADLAQRVTLGDHEAFDLLVERHLEALFRFAALSCPSVQEAERVVREALLAAWGQAGTMGPNPRIWLFKHVRLACCSSRPAPRVDSGEFLIPLVSSAPETGAAPLGGMSCIEALAQISDFIDGELTADQAARMESHQRLCERCAELGASLRAVVESLHRRGQRAEKIPASLKVQHPSRLEK